MDNCVLALGFFDGAHLGHQELFAAARGAALKLGLRSAALTFDRHPKELILGVPQALLNTAADRRRLISRYVDDARFLRFDERVMQMPWETFITEVCVKEHGARHLVCGEDYRFGWRGMGDHRRLEEKCAALGLGCTVVPQLRLDGTVVSSTRIRELVAAGDIQEATRFLGHYHLLTGTVIHGRGLGGKALVATANLPFPAGVAAPPRGVYATLANGIPAVTNLGLNPTVGELNALSVETHLIDFTGDLSGERLTLEFRRFLRPEQKFPDLPALREQILKDIAAARA